MGGMRKLKVHVAPLGTVKEPILAGIHHFGANEVYLFATRGVEKESYPLALSLSMDLKRIGISVVIEEIDLFDFMGNLKRIVTKINEIRKKRPAAQIYVNVTGGTKPMAQAALIAAFLTDSQPYYVQEKPLKVIQLPTFPKAGTKPIRGKQRDILTILVNGPMSVSGLSKTIGISTTAVSHNLKRLENMGLIKSEAAGRAKRAKLTELGLWWAWMIKEGII